MRLPTLRFEVGFGAYYKKAARLLQAFQPFEVDIASVHEVEGAGLGYQQIEHIGVVQFAVADLQKRGDIPAQVQKRVRFNRRLGRAKWCSRKHRPTRVDGAGVQRVDRALKIHAKYFDLRTLSAAHWLRPDGLRGPLRLSRWHGLASTAIDKLRRRIAEENFCPESLLPGVSDYYGATASFALRDERNRVIGWTLCERPDHDTVVVANLFVGPDYWRRGGIAWRVDASVASGLAAGTSRGSFMTSNYFALMTASAERRLRPYASSVRISFETSSTLPARLQESAIEAACLDYR